MSTPAYDSGTVLPGSVLSAAAAGVSARPDQMLASMLAAEVRSKEEPVRLRQGVVTDTSLTYGANPTITVNLGGTDVPGCRYLIGYVPTNGDVVWCLRNGLDVLVMGPLISEGNKLDTTPALTAGGWYRIAETIGGDRAFTNSSGSGQYTPDPRAHARFVLNDTAGGKHARTEFAAGIAFNSSITPTSQYVQTVFSTSYGASRFFTKTRLLTSGTYNPSYLEVYCSTAYAGGTNIRLAMYDNTDWPAGWRLVPWQATASIPAGYTAREYLFADEGDSWTTMTLLNGWVAYGSGWAAPAYRYTTGGDVQFRGLMKHATTTTTGVFVNMPAGLRVANGLIFNQAAGATSAAGFCRVDVTTNGDCKVTSYGAASSGSYVSLAGISYRPDS